jgi:two-component system, chemotaxis family, chemotaxis protein CheY
MAYNILVVDDSVTVRSVIARSLELAGVPLGTLFQAGNGEEGLEVLRKEWVDLVLADINMPVMGGVAMIEEMKEDEGLSGIPVIIISTEGSATRIADLKEKGVRAFLRKPFAPEDLKRAVDALLGKGEPNG